MLSSVVIVMSAAPRFFLTKLLYLSEITAKCFRKFAKI